MVIFDNINKIVRDDLAVNIKTDSRVSIAAACFSIYAFLVAGRHFLPISSYVFRRTEFRNFEKSRLRTESASGA